MRIGLCLSKTERGGEGVNSRKNGGRGSPLTRGQMSLRAYDTY